jgi:hypothetical protein
MWSDTLFLCFVLFVRFCVLPSIEVLLNPSVCNFKYGVVIADTEFI